MGSNAAQPTRKRSSHGGELVGSPRGGGGSCGSFQNSETTIFRCENVSSREVKHKQTWTLFFCMFQVRSQGRNYVLEDSFFSKCKIFYALVGGAGFWRGHWIFVKMFFYNTFGLRMSHKWKSCWELLWKSLKSPRNFKVEIGRMSQLNSYGGS